MAAGIRFKNADGEPALADGNVYAHGLSSAATARCDLPPPLSRRGGRPRPEGSTQVISSFPLSAFTETRITNESVKP